MSTETSVCLLVGANVRALVTAHRGSEALDGIAGEEEAGAFEAVFVLEEAGVPLDERTFAFNRGPLALGEGGFGLDEEPFVGGHGHLVDDSDESNDSGWACVLTMLTDTVGQDTRGQRMLTSSTELDKDGFPEGCQTDDWMSKCVNIQC
jgi:hypothetical protein